jgi:hypothetical protein
MTTGRINQVSVFYTRPFGFLACQQGCNVART